MRPGGVAGRSARPTLPLVPDNKTHLAVFLIGLSAAEGERPGLEAVPIVVWMEVCGLVVVGKRQRLRGKGVLGSFIL